MYKIRETDVKDPQGTVIISPGLKVRHKDSQFEYTVDSVIQGDSDDLEVVLKLPDEARFEPPSTPSDVIHAQSKNKPNMMYEIDPTALYYEPDLEQLPEENPEPEMISVSQEEFERDYEVK